MRHFLMRLLIVLALVWAVMFDVYADVKLLRAKSLQTPQGELAVQPYWKGRPVEWNDFSRFREADEFRVTLNHHLITAFSPDEWEGIFFRAAYPSQNNARLILVALWPGGNTCNGFFRVIEIPDKSKPIISEKFGNCLDVAFTDEYKLDQNPIYRDGAWYIGLESMNTSVEHDIAWWTYKDGHVIQADEQDPEVAKWPAEQQRYIFQLQMRVSEDERKRLIEQYGNPKDAYYGWLTKKLRDAEPDKYR